MTLGNFCITFLGTSAASPSLNPSTSAYLVEINQTRILIDAGIGTLRQMKKIKVSPEDIDIILITHWHLDHYAGLPAVLRAARRSTKLSIYGPAIPYFARVYLTALSGSHRKMLPITSPNFSLTYADFCLQAITTFHIIDSFGWAIIEQPEVQPHTGRKIIISGDTRPAQSILNAARSADLLVHEATYLDKDAGKARLNQHSTAAEAAQIAAQSGVGALALTHISNRYSQLEIRAEAQKIFPQVLIPLPLDTIHLDPIPIGNTKENHGWAQIRMEPHTSLYFNGQSNPD